MYDVLYATLKPEFELFLHTRQCDLRLVVRKAAGCAIVSLPLQSFILCRPLRTQNSSAMPPLIPQAWSSHDKLEAASLMTFWRAPWTVRSRRVAPSRFGPSPSLSLPRTTFAVWGRVTLPPFLDPPPPYHGQVLEAWDPPPVTTDGCWDVCVL